MNRLDYKSNYQKALERLEQFYNHRPQDCIYTCFDVPSPARFDFRQTHSPGYCSYPELIGATNTYLSLIENPGLVREAIDFAFELNLLVQTTFEVLDELKSGCAAVPLVVEADYSSFVRRLQNRGVPGGVLYHIRNVPDIETANLLMPDIIDYRADMQP
jgi:hypothetical protein